MDYRRQDSASLPATGNNGVTLSSGMNFIFRDFGVIRIKTLTMIQTVTDPSFNSPIREINQRAESQVSSLESPERLRDMEEDEDLYTIENHYAVYSFYDDYKCLSRGEIFVQLQLDGVFKELVDKVYNVANLLKMSPEDFKDKIYSDKEKLCKTIFD